MNFKGYKLKVVALHSTDLNKISLEHKRCIIKFTILEQCMYTFKKLKKSV
jgi:hypothetical protein